ncbi:MAG: hypothetical protein OEY11_14545 [Gammaproteobacteria bacterium]|nr:hypothetical protein [Gammaproteobacteria bacterium]
MVLRSSDLTPITDVDGDSDFYKVIDDSESNPLLKDKRVVAKHSTGGMISHGGGIKPLSGDSVDAIYSLWDSGGAEEYYKIATLQYYPTKDNGEYVELDLYYGGLLFSNKGGMKIGLSNRGGFLKRVYSIYGAINNISKVGIKAYIETDSTISVYMYHATAPGSHLTIKLSTSAYGHGAIIVPPHKLISIPSPSGTLSFDTTSGKYADGVPDGSEDLKTIPTMQNGWTILSGSINGYERYSSGLVNLNFYITAGITTDGTLLFTMPAGYRPSSDITLKLHASGGAVGASARLSISASGAVVFYGLGSATNIIFNDSYKAGG